MTNIQPGDVFVKTRGGRNLILLMLPRTERSGKQPYVRLSTQNHNIDSAYWTDRDRVGNFSSGQRYRYVGTVPPAYIDIIVNQEVKLKFTVIVCDYSEHASSPTTRAVKVTGTSPEDAASAAEVEIATEIWNRRYPELGEPYDQNPRMDDEWIDCMESAGTKAVIAGHPKVYVEDEIYELTTKERHG
jgi:hypothetical protein